MCMEILAKAIQDIADKHNLKVIYDVAMLLVVKSMENLS